MNDKLDRFAPVLPVLGILLLLAGGIAYYINRSFDIVTNSLLLAGVIFLLLFVIFRPDDIRRLVGGRQVKYGTITILSIVFFIIIGVLLYWIAYKNEDWRYDLTATNEFTPLPETIELLESFDEPIDVIGFYSEASFTRQATARDRLTDLSAYKSNLSFEFVDPVSNPILANQYGVTSDSTLVFIRNKGQADEITSQAATTTDRDLHTALVQLINPIKKMAYFLTGHGEFDPTSVGPDSASEVAGSIEDLGFTVQQLNLVLEGTIPEDADVVVVLGQRAPMQAEEVSALNDYLSAGGAALIARDVFLEEGQLAAEEDNVRQMLLDEWGVRFRSDFIVEPELGAAGQQVPVQFLALDFGTSPITSADLQDLGVFFNIARSVDIQEMAGITYVDLARTSTGSWGESNLVDFPQPGPEDAQGPVTVALSAENLDTGSRLIVVGDADFWTNQAALARGNLLFFANSMSWLAGDEAALDLTPRETIDRTLAITESQLSIIRAISCLTAPGLVALIGLVVWYSRRRTK